MSVQRCDACKFWVFGWSTDENDEKFHEDDFMGECRRFPPIRSDDGESCFPEISASMWCGEFHSDNDPRTQQLNEKYESLPKLPSGRLSRETMEIWDQYLDGIGIGRGRAKQLMRGHSKK